MGPYWLFGGIQKPYGLPVPLHQPHIFDCDRPAAFHAEVSIAVVVFIRRQLHSDLAGPLPLGPEVVLGIPHFELLARGEPAAALNGRSRGMLLCRLAQQASAIDPARRSRHS